MTALPIQESQPQLHLVPDLENVPETLGTEQNMNERVQVLLDALANKVVPDSVEQSQVVMDKLSELNRSVQQSLQNPNISDNGRVDPEVAEELDEAVQSGVNYWRLGDELREDMTAAVQADKFEEMPVSMQSLLRNSVNNDEEARDITSDELKDFQIKLGKHLLLDRELAKQGTEPSVEPDMPTAKEGDDIKPANNPEEHGQGFTITDKRGSVRNANIDDEPAENDEPAEDLAAMADRIMAQLNPSSVSAGEITHDTPDISVEPTSSVVANTVQDPAVHVQPATQEAVKKQTLSELAASGYRWKTSREAYEADMRAWGGLRYKKVGERSSGLLTEQEYLIRLSDRLKQYESPASAVQPLNYASVESRRRPRKLSKEVDERLGQTIDFIGRVALSSFDIAQEATADTVNMLRRANKTAGRIALAALDVSVEATTSVAAKLSHTTKRAAKRVKLHSKRTARHK